MLTPATSFAHLANLKAELELALRRERSADELRDALVSVNDEVDRPSALADELLVLARSDEAGHPLRCVQISVTDLLDRLRDCFDPQHMTITVTVPDDIRLIGDRERLEQALGNLIDNAIRYGSVKVTLRPRRPSRAPSCMCRTPVRGSTRLRSAGV